MSIRLDVLSVWRGLLKQKSTSIAAVLTLGVGVGLATASLSVFDAVLLRPLTFPNAERVVSIVQLLPANGTTIRAGLTSGQLRALSEGAGADVFDRVGAYRTQAASVSLDDGTRRLTGVRISAQLLGGISPKPVLGRGLSERDESVSAAPVAVISSQVWRSLFAGDERVLERSIVVADVPHQIVGVMPSDFKFPHLPGGFRNAAGQLDGAPEFWLPFDATGDSAAAFSLWPTVGILAPNVELAVANRVTGDVLPSLPSSERQGTEVVAVNDELTRPVRRALGQIRLASLLVLLVAAVNLANLLVAKREARRNDTAVRLALGATTLQIARQSLIEGLMLSAAAALLGLLIAADILLAIRFYAPASIPRLADVRLDVMAGVGAAVLALAAGTFSSVLAWLSQRGQASSDLGRGVGVASVRGGLGTRSGGLVIVQIAATVILVSSAAALAQGFVRASATDAGFDRANLLTLRFNMQGPRYETGVDVIQAVRAVRTAIAHLPGVVAVGASGQPRIRSGVKVEGGPERSEPVAVRIVDDGYFEALAVSTLRGRTPVSDTTSGEVAVNEAFASSFGTDVLGRYITIGDWPPMPIVGVVGDLRFGGGDAPVAPEVFVSSSEVRAPAASTWAIRSAAAGGGDAARITEVVRRYDPDLAIFDLVTADQQWNESVSDERFYAVAGAVFAVAGLVLAGLGLYALLAYMVRLKAAEFAVRLALGATPAGVAAGVVRQALVVSGLGAVVGVIAALAMGKVLAAALVGVLPPSVALLLASAAVLVAVSVVAALLPAIHAMQQSPSAMLKS